jgi:hypothetical protein
MIADSLLTVTGNIHEYPLWIILAFVIKIMQPHSVDHIVLSFRDRAIGNSKKLLSERLIQSFGIS